MKIKNLKIGKAEFRGNIQPKILHETWLMGDDLVMEKVELAPQKDSQKSQSLKSERALAEKVTNT